ncbi:ABC transporter ATP-binding protein [Bosea sp. 2YAB26]|uniref:ABC transporter ATP-binding protein n=1 Tax=Bosea sp. 2YAB26 TaxID=3237478 RepID=UPI003F8FC599
MSRPEAKTVLTADVIHKSYGDFPVLKGVSLAARERDVICMIGASGSGKSTFLRCINLLETPESGTISFEGEEIKLQRSGDRPPVLNARQISRIRSRMGMVFQSFNLWSHLTVLENVTIAPIKVLGVAKAEAIERAEALLAKVGLFDKRYHYPAHISGGQQQRCAIARALAMEPKLLLFDEPTSALDPELVGEVLRVMRVLAEEGRTMIVVTHEMAFAREVSNEVLFLHEGKIEERNSPDQIFGNPMSERCRRFLQRVL